jgi:hypothetical protein
VDNDAGAVQEFGAPSRNIPPRPFFRNMIARKRNEWPTAVAKPVSRRVMTGGCRILDGPVPRIGTLILADLAAWMLPFTSGRQVLTFREPDSASRRLHAGCRSGSLQANPRAYPGSWTHLRFRHHLWHFDTSSAVRFRSPLRTIPDGISSRLLLQRSPQPLLTIAACSGLRPAPDCRPRGALPHLLYSSTPSFTEAVFVTHHPVAIMATDGFPSEKYSDPHARRAAAGDR